MKKLLAAVMGAAMAMTLVGAMGVASATPIVAHPVKAVVVNRHMVPGGVSVTLTGILSNTLPNGARYTWDYTNDGVFESPLRPTPVLTYIYRGPMAASSVTATIAVYMPGSTMSYRDSVTFSLRIPFLHGHGPVLHGHGPILHGHGPVLHGHGPVLHGHSPVLHS